MRCRTRSPPFSHHPCVNPVSSRNFAGSLKKIWHDTANTFSSANPSSSGRRKSAATRMSLLSSTTISFVAARNPAFDPPPNPMFVWFRITRTVGNRSARNSADPSVLASSTTITSFPSAAAITLGRYFSSRSRPFQFGITMLALVTSGRTSAASAFRPRSRTQTSVNSSATAGTPINTGEATSSGKLRPRRCQNPIT